MLESAAVARAAAEVGRQEGVALGQEVLRQAVPLVQIAVSYTHLDVYKRQHDNRVVSAVLPVW